MAKDEAVPLLVTTAHRGVFFGLGTPSDAKTIRLEQARMCVSWSSDMHGVLGLASKGPSKNCRIGPAVPALTLNDVTMAVEVSPEAAAAWEKQPWN